VDNAILFCSFFILDEKKSKKLEKKIGKQEKSQEKKAEKQRKQDKLQVEKLLEEKEEEIKRLERENKGLTKKLQATKRLQFSPVRNLILISFNFRWP